MHVRKHVKTVFLLTVYELVNCLQPMFSGSFAQKFTRKNNQGFVILSIRVERHHQIRLACGNFHSAVNTNMNDTKVSSSP